MLFFVNDYGEGAHPKILQRLSETNFEHLSGYGTDPYTESARKKILSACHAPDGQVFLLVGGTQTNEFLSSPTLHSDEWYLRSKYSHHRSRCLLFQGVEEGPGWSHLYQVPLGP